MDAVRYERIQALFHGALEQPEGERPEYVRAAAGNDAALAADVLAMLAEDAGASLLDRDLAGLAAEMLEGDPESPLPRQAFGPYRVRRVLGEGGMGVVYLAERSDLGSLAAVKLLRDAALSPARRERFVHEQRTLAQLNHPSIPQLYDTGVLPDGTPWFVMEYVEGDPLTAYCRERGSTVAERLALFRAVCEAVQYAHRHLIIHRDLKPSNILVKPDGGIKLLDFGISKLLEDGDGAPDPTRTGLRMMTPAYAAPEQIRGQPVGIHTDIYALGLILYELLAGRQPFDLSGKSPSEIETIIVEREPERPSAAALRLAALTGDSARVRSLGPSAWADLDVLCLTAAHKDPQRRYRTVEALIRDIDHYLRGEPLEARPDSARYRAGKYVRRNWRPLSAAALVLATVISLVVFYTVRLAGARNAALAEVARTQRIQHFTMHLFEGGEDAVAPAESLRVVELVDRGVRDARSLERDPAIQAELYETLGTLLLRLGSLDRADTLLRAALEQRRALFGPDHPDVAASLISLGTLRMAQAEYDSAERLVREGLATSRQSLPADHPAVLQAEIALGDVLYTRGDYTQAIPVLEEAVRGIAARDSASPDLDEALSHLANAHFYAGHHAISDSLNQRVLAMSRRLYGDHHPHVADDLINLGALASEAGDFTAAERYDREALEIFRAWYGENHFETADAMKFVGRALIAQNRYAEAAGLLRQSLAIQERVYGPVHPSIASTLSDLGKVEQQAGRLDAAEADFRRMADIARTVYGDQHFYIAVALSNLGSVSLDRKRYRRAEQYFRDAVRRFTAAQGAGHQNTGIARIRLGRSLALQRRFSEAEQESRGGYDILLKQDAPPQAWLRMARTDLVTEYEGLGKPEMVARFRAELADTVRAAH